MKILSAITTYGRWILLVALVLLVTGVLAGWLELVAISAALFAMAAISVLMVLGGHQYTVLFELHRNRIVAGERAMVVVSVKNETHQRIRPVVMEVPVKNALYRTVLPAIPAGGEYEEIISIQTSARALMPIGPVMTVRGDPLGILARRIKRSQVSQLAVHPRTIPISATLVGATQDLDGLESQELVDSDLNFHALREYETGDDRRSIHWRSSAKGQGLLVKQYTMSQRTAITICIDHRTENYADVKQQEEAISIAGSLGASVLRAGGLVDLLWQGTHIPAPSAAVLLDGLAEIEFDAPSPFHPRLRAHTSASTFLISGTPASFASIRELGRGLPAGQPVIAIRAGFSESLQRKVWRNFTLVEPVNLDNLRQALALVAR